MEGQRDERSSWFPKALPKTGKILDPGCYRATLKGIFPGKSKGFDGSGERLTLMFSFQIEGSGEVINRTVNASNAEKSQCLQLVRNLAGIKQPSTDEIADPERFQKFIETLCGTTYLLQVQPSANGRYNNLLAAFPEPSK